MTNIQERIKIWQGLENFRQVLLDLLANDLGKINQATLDKVFSGYNFQLLDSKRDKLIEAIEHKLTELEPTDELYQQLKQELENIKSIDEEVVLKREIPDFSYEYVFRAPKGTIVNLSGFVKILAKNNPHHKALLSWQANKRNPILFLAELLPQADGNNAIYFHINLGGDDGLAIIEDAGDNYRWNQCLKHDYPDLMNAEFGSVLMNKTTKAITLESANMTAAAALGKAQSQTAKGISLFENNVTLMEVYKQDLESLDFNY